MLADLNRAAIDGQADVMLFGALWQRIQRQLEAEKERVYQEIRSYPPPIPACDVQYNGLLVERAAIREELDRVNDILKREPTAQEQIVLLGEWVESSQFLSDELTNGIRQALAESPAYANSGRRAPGPGMPV